MAIRFYYWREVLFLLLMVAVLLLDMTFFEILSPFGDEGARSGAISLGAH